MFAPLADFQERGDTTCPPGTGISQGGGPPPKEMVTQLGVATQPLDSQHPHNKPTPVLDLSRTVNEDIINWLMSPNAPEEPITLADLLARPARHLLAVGRPEPVWIQAVAATASANASHGVMKPRAFRGLVLSDLAMESSCRWL